MPGFYVDSRLFKFTTLHSERKREREKVCVCEGEREDGREADSERTGTQIVKDKEEKGRVIERKKDKQIKKRSDWHIGRSTQKESGR